MNLNEAIRIANYWLGDQTDYTGQPLILHSLRVMLMGKTENEQIVGVLHHVLSDTALSIGMFTHVFSADIVDALRHITRPYGVGYLPHILSLSRCPLAAQVKLYDVRDRLSTVWKTPDPAPRFGQYLEAKLMLLGGQHDSYFVSPR